MTIGGTDDNRGGGMRELTERAYFRLCRFLGWLLRSGRYSTVRFVDRDGERQVRKQRLFYAPLLVWLGDPLVRILDTGVRVLRQREWVEREMWIHRNLRGTSIGIDADRTLVLPYLSGETLATLLEDPELAESMRRKAIELAVLALVELHRHGLTHGDAMAENVMVDLEAGVAHWFDFETLHDSGRPMNWRRADDVRALIATALLRTGPKELTETLRLILDVYSDEEVTAVLATSFTSILQRPLTFHLGQAGLPFATFQEIGRLLRERVGD
jgi:serine/threonine protein kinase